MFDPYHKWLAIPPDQRPPTYYQLLGVAPTESDREVIEEAALRQTSHVRTYQAGPHAEECTKLLNEIAEARRTLVNPAKRAEYDALVGGREAEKNISVTPPLEKLKVATVHPPVSLEAAEPPVESEFRDTEVPNTPFHLVYVGATVYVALLLVGGVLAFCLTIAKPGGAVLKRRDANNIPSEKSTLDAKP